MIALNQFTVSTTKISENEVKFEISPLPKGYGNTLGNILRRILLSSVPGSAITAVKIDGVTHEYTSVEGMKDDALTILLAMKNIVVSSNTEDDVELEIDVLCNEDKVVEVTAGDIKSNSAVDVINKDYVITTLTKKGARFKASLVVSKGVGYQYPNQEVRKELGMIPLDATFSPVLLVTYEIVPTRVGQTIDLDQLNLYVKTNGSSTPEDAFYVTSTILQTLSVHMFMNAERVIEGEVAPVLLSTQTVDDVESVWGDSNLNSNTKSTTSRQPVPVVDLNLSTRLTNALLRSGYDDLNMLGGMTQEDLVNIRGMGAKSLDELIAILKKYEITVI